MNQRLDSSVYPMHDRLDLITTHWSRIHDPAHFVLRYASAVRRYMGAILKDIDQVDEACHDFILRVVQKGLNHADPASGRFRDYLKAAVRNAALSQFRKQKRTLASMEMCSVEPTVPSKVEEEADAAWLAEWRRCLLDRALMTLKHSQRDQEQALYYRALRLVMKYPEENSTQLADRLSEQLHRRVRADTFRKQVSRARRIFAQLLVEEVIKTLRDATPERIEDELQILGLWDIVNPIILTQAGVAD